MQLRVALAGIVTASLVIAACGGSDASSGDSNPSPASSVPTTEPGGELAQPTSLPDPTSETVRSTSVPESSATTTTTLSADEPADAVCGEYTSNDELPLSLCDEGVEVSGVQFDLVRFGADVGVDGFFGPATESAVRAFQSDNGLPATGVVDEATRAALNPGSVPDPDSAPNPGSPTAVPLADLAVGEVSIASNTGVARYEVVVSCSPIAVLAGLSGASSLLWGDDGSLLTLDIWVDEGYSSLVISRVTGVAGPLSVLAGTSNIYPWIRWATNFENSIGDIDRLTLESTGATYDPESGLDVGSINVSYRPQANVDCDTVSVRTWDDLWVFRPVDDTLLLYNRPVLASCPGAIYLLGDGAVVRETWAVIYRVELVQSGTDGSGIEIWATPTLDFIGEEFLLPVGSDGTGAKVIPWEVPYNPRAPVLDGTERLLTVNFSETSAPSIACG